MMMPHHTTINRTGHTEEHRTTAHTTNTVPQQQQEKERKNTLQLFRTNRDNWQHFASYCYENVTIV